MIRKLLLLCLLLPPLLAAATNPYAPGDRLSPLSLSDQRGAPAPVGEQTRLVLFSRDMSGGKVIRKALEGLDPAPLKRGEVVYLADISGMPGLIARFIALPTMRKYPYPITLDHDGDATRRLPSKEGEVTVLHLEGLRIGALEFTTDPERVRAAIVAAAPEAAAGQGRGQQ
ncbi:MAG: FAD/FMN-containing dehydrogenase [Gammaproteobacteria bacterium]|nr:MAG: FAD/FMN-containing dehydrogenase [Gammaproteobacteria bacterium]